MAQNPPKADAPPVSAPETAASPGASESNPVPGGADAPPAKISGVAHFVLIARDYFASLAEGLKKVWEYQRLGVLLVRRNREYVVRGKAEFAQLKRFREFLSRHAKRAGLPPKRIANASLVLDEMVTNIIRHAYKDMERGDVVIGVTWLRDRLLVKMRDWGVEFDWNRVLNPDLKKYVEVKRKGGLGIMIIRKLTDDATYERLGDINQTTLTFKLNLEEKRRLWQIFLADFRRRLSITSRFMILGLAFMAGVSITVYTVINRTLVQRIETSLLTKGLDSARSVSAAAASAMENGDSLVLNELVASVKEGIVGVRYAALVDTNALTLAHTDPERVFLPYEEPAPDAIVRRDRAAGTPFLVYRYKPPGGREEPVYDFSLPILVGERPLGTVRLGIAKNSLENAKDESRSRWQTRILVASLFLVVVIFLLYMGNAFVSPIKNFAEAIAQIGTLDFNMEKIKNIRVAEFEAIEQALSKMTGRLKDAEVQLTDQTRIKREMQLAKDIQEQILPRVIPTTEGFELDGRYRSALEMGGDYFDFFEVGENLMGIVVGDVSGKGIGAAFIMAMARMAMRSESQSIRRASDVLAKVDALIGKDIKKGMYITVFYAVLDSEKRTISYASAGHNPMILYRGSEKSVYFLNPKGIAIGLAVEEGFFKKIITSETITLQSDDLIFMYTDGITEAMNPQRKEYGEARLVEFIKAHHDRTIKEFCDLLDKDIEQFTAGYPQSDDITYIVVKAKPTADEIRYQNIVRLYDLLKQGAKRPDALAECGIPAAEFAAIDRAVRDEGIESLKPEPVSALSHATIEQSQKIITIIRTHPDFGPARILKELNSAAFGFEIMTENVLGKELKKLKLVTAAQRQRYAERRIASTSIHVGVTATLASPESSSRAATARHAAAENARQVTEEPPTESTEAPNVVPPPPEEAPRAARPTPREVEPAPVARRAIPASIPAGIDPIPEQDGADDISPSLEAEEDIEIETAQADDAPEASAPGNVEEEAPGGEIGAGEVLDGGMASGEQEWVDEATPVAGEATAEGDAGWNQEGALESDALDEPQGQPPAEIDAWSAAEETFAQTGALPEEPLVEVAEEGVEYVQEGDPQAAGSGEAGWDQAVDPALTAGEEWLAAPAEGAGAWNEGSPDGSLPAGEEAGAEGGVIQENSWAEDGAEAAAIDAGGGSAPAAEAIETQGGAQEPGP